MRKTLFLLNSLALVFLLLSCGLLDKEFDLVGFENIVYWEFQDDADFYEVYQDDEYLGETLNNYYMVDENHLTNIKVKGCKVLKNGKSDCEIASKPISLTLTESMENHTKIIDVTNLSTFNIVVDSNINKIVLQSNGSYFHNDSSIKIAKRRFPLIIELINIRFSAKDNENAISFIDSTGYIPPMIIISSGTQTNRVYAGNSTRQTGLSGLSAVIGDNILITGNNDIIFNGTDGLDGEDGENGKVFGDRYPEDGQHGGNGGSAIECKNLFVNMSIDEVKVTVRYGDGGEGGKGGQGIPLVSEDGRDGRDGSDGEGVKHENILAIFKGLFLIEKN